MFAVAPMYNIISSEQVLKNSRQLTALLEDDRTDRTVGFQQPLVLITIKKKCTLGATRTSPYYPTHIQILILNQKNKACTGQFFLRALHNTRDQRLSSNPKDKASWLIVLLFKDTSLNSVLQPKQKISKRVGRFLYAYFMLRRTK